MNLKILIIFILFFGILKSLNGQDYKISNIHPPFLKIVVPSSGFVPMNTSLNDMPCDTIADSLWQRQPADSFDLLIAADGPKGSGRFWNVTIGLAESGQKIPNRGVCLTSSTIGWRTIQSFNNVPLKWIDDKNKNGLPEIIIWDSFPLHQEATLAEYGLIAWIYEYNCENEFKINWKLTKEILLEISSAYRKPIKGATKKTTNMRQTIAKNLDSFIFRQIPYK